MITILMVIKQSVNVTNVTIVSNYVRVVPLGKTPGYDYNTVVLREAEVYSLPCSRILIHVDVGCSNQTGDKSAARP